MQQNEIQPHLFETNVFTKFNNKNIGNVDFAGYEHNHIRALNDKADAADIALIAELATRQLDPSDMIFILSRDTIFQKFANEWNQRTKPYLHVGRFEFQEILKMTNEFGIRRDKWVFTPSLMSTYIDCHLCDKTSKTEEKLRYHLYKKHGITQT